MTAPSRPILRWHGGKWRLAPWIIGHFPPHRVYVEPFGGGASVLLQKPRCRTEIYNDLDSDVVNLFRVIREEAGELERALALTPYARDEYADLYRRDDCSAVERARRFIARSFMGMSSKGALANSGFDARINEDAFVSRLRSLSCVGDELAAIAGRMTEVVIENVDAKTLILRCDREDALIYCDPPYVPDKRSGRHYRHEMSLDDHRALLALLLSCRSMVLVSGYESALYDELLGAWRREERSVLTDGSHRRIEVLWINPAAAAALDARAGGIGTPLFGVAGMAREAAE